MGITAKDVAKRANVSPATVSMVFRNKPGISEATRQKVLAAARELQFEYSNAVKVHRSEILQLLVFKRHGKVIADTPFFERMTAGISSRARELGYQLTISYFYGNQDVDEQLRSIKSVRCSGLLLLATEMHMTDLAIFESLRLPIVLLDNWFPGTKYDAVVIDNQSGAIAATNYLMKKGHQRIGYLHSKVKIHNFAERQEGFLRAIQKLSDSTVRPSRWIIPVGTTAETACKDMALYLKDDPFLPTAFFADNDHIAVGCMNALRQAGYRLPQEISIIGFDDMPVGVMTEPQLTTMQVPSERLGALAVERLDAKLRGLTGGETIRIALSPTVLERESVWDQQSSKPTSK